jgi:hypothetical protein
LDEAEKSAFGANNMREQIQGYLEDASRARLQAEEARREVERLRRELAGGERAGAQKARSSSMLDIGEDNGAIPGQLDVDDL